MMKIYIVTIAFLLLCIDVYASGFVIGSGVNPPSYDYCVRADGTALLASATDCSDASTSMSVATFNASSFSGDDIIDFSSRGGGFTNAVVIPSSGTVGHSIIYEGESGHEPTWTGSYGWTIQQSYVEINGITVNSTTESSFLFGDGNNTYTGIVTHNLSSANATNQSYQHLDGIDVVHYNMYGTSALDEIVSLHNDNAGVTDPVVTIYGLTIENTHQGLNWVGAPTLSVYDFSITGIDTDAYPIQPANSGGVHIFERGYVEEPTGMTGYRIDCTYGAWSFKNVIFKNLTDGSYYLLGRGTTTGFDVINCTFIGDGVNTTTAIFNQYAGNYINNIFLNVGNGTFFSSSTGTIDYNLFYGSGVAVGTNYVTTDPNLDADGKIQSAGSSAYDAGVGPESNALVPIVDIDADTRSGATCDIGADEYVD